MGGGGGGVRPDHAVEVCTESDTKLLLLLIERLEQSFRQDFVDLSLVVIHAKKVMLISWNE